MASFDDYKHALASAISSITDRNMYDHLISAEDKQKIQQIVQQHIATIQSQKDIVILLDQLAKTWPIFRHLYMLESAKLPKTAKKQIADNIRKVSTDKAISPEEAGFFKRINEIEGEILQVIVNSIREEKLTQEASQPIAQYVLEQIDRIENRQQLLLFLKELTSKWPMFQPLIDIEQGKIERKIEEKTAQDVATLIRSGRTKQALQLADKTME